MKKVRQAKKLSALLLGDFKNISRDSMLIAMVFAPLILIILVRTAVPYLTDLFLRELKFDLASYYFFMAGFLTLISPMLFGTVFGFMLLDERDEEVLTYISVTPLGKAQFLLYRIFVPVIISIITSLLFLGTTHLVTFDLLKLLPIAIIASLEAPMLALFLAAFAGNKVEGLALAKAMGILYIAPFIGYFVNSNWQLLAGISPPYWITKAMIASVQGTSTAYWFYISGGLIVHLIVICILLKRFEQRTM